jgi:hypothetical protein
VMDSLPEIGRGSPYDTASRGVMLPPTFEATLSRQASALRRLTAGHTGAGAKTATPFPQLQSSSEACQGGGAGNPYLRLAPNISRCRNQHASPISTKRG